MNISFRRFTVAMLAGAMLVSAGSGSAFAQAKPNNVKPPEEPKKPEPFAIKLVSAQRGKFYGSDVLVVNGIEPLSGKQRTLAVENQKPDNPKDPPKYAPNERVKSAVDKVKPGEYLRIELKASKDGKDWIDKAEVYALTEHEDEPGTFIMRGSFEDDEKGTKVQKIELVKFAHIFDCYAQMVKDEKSMVPDPEIVKASKAVKEKDIVEATLTQQGNHFIVTSIDAYSAPRKATLTKVTEIDAEGGKAPAVELDEGGKSITVMLPGKLNGKKWVADAAMLSNVKKVKPGSAVLFKTRDIEQKSQLRAFAAAPKEPVKKEGKDSKDGKDSNMKEK